MTAINNETKDSITKPPSYYQYPGGNDISIYHLMLNFHYHVSVLFLPYFYHFSAIYLLRTFLILSY